MTTQDPVLYAVCDGEKARFLRFDGHQLRTVKTFDVHSGETNAAAEVGSLKDARTDPHAQVKERFARDMAKEINDAFRADGALEGLVLSAPGHTLHDIREHLSKPVAARLVKTESKDFTNTPDHELIQRFDRPATGWRIPG